MGAIPTIKVMRRGELEPVIINTSDFDAARMEVWVDPAMSAPVSPQAAPNPEPMPTPEPEKQRGTWGGRRVKGAGRG